MKEGILKILKHSSVYLVADIASKAIGFVLIPVYTIYFTPADYGTLNVVQLTCNFLFIIFTSALMGAFSRFFFDFKDHSPEQKIFLGNILTYITIASLLIIGLLLIFSRPLFHFIFPDVEFYPYIAAAFGITFFQIFSEAKLTIYRVRQQPVYYAALNLSAFVLNLLLTLFMVVVLKKGLDGKIFSDFVLGILFFLTATFLLRKDLKPNLNLSKLKEPLKYSLPLIPHLMSSFILFGIDRIFLANMMTMEEVGIYSLANNFGLIVLNFTTALRMAYTPFFYREVQEKGDAAKPLLSKITTYFFTLTFFVALGIALFSREIISLLSTSGYHEASSVLPVIVLTYVIEGFYGIFCAPLFYVKTATRYVSVATFTGAIINAVLNYFLIMKFGMMGAAWATMGSMLVMMLLSLYYAQKNFRIDYEFRRFFLIGVISAAIMSLHLLLSQLEFQFWLLAGAKAILFMLFPLSLFAFGIFSGAETAFVRQLVSGAIAKIKS